MADSQLLEITETVDAPPIKVFALLADPSRHVEIDGSGTVRGHVSGPCPVTGIGDEFVMEMHQDITGSYRTRNRIVDYEPNKRIIWATTLEPPDALSRL